MPDEDELRAIRGWKSRKTAKKTKEKIWRADCGHDCVVEHACRQRPECNWIKVINANWQDNNTNYDHHDHEIATEMSDGRRVTVAATVTWCGVTNDLSSLSVQAAFQARSSFSCLFSSLSKLWVLSINPNNELFVRQQNLHSQPNSVNVSLACGLIRPTVAASFNVRMVWRTRTPVPPVWLSTNKMEFAIGRKMWELAPHRAKAAFSVQHCRNCFRNMHRPNCCSRCASFSCTFKRDTRIRKTVPSCTFACSAATDVFRASWNASTAKCSTPRAASVTYRNTCRDASTTMITTKTPLTRQEKETRLPRTAITKAIENDWSMKRREELKQLDHLLHWRWTCQMFPMQMSMHV